MPDSKIDVSLTDFIDFAIKAGTPKLTKVRQVRDRGPYSPATDYWKPLREKLQELHAAGPVDGRILQRFAEGYHDSKKVERYKAAVNGYRKFLGRRQVSWFNPPHTVWAPNRLAVRINPELGLMIGGERHIIKLYFKDEKLSKHRVDLLTFLLRRQLQNSGNTSFGVLDVSNGKFFPATAASLDLMPLLVGEAASFVSIWDGLGAG